MRSISSISGIGIDDGLPAVVLAISRTGVEEGLTGVIIAISGAGVEERLTGVIIAVRRFDIDRRSLCIGIISVAVINIHDLAGLAIDGFIARFPVGLKVGG